MAALSSKKRPVAASSQSFEPVRILFLTALILFGVVTVGINYQVKVNIQGAPGGRTVREMGNVKLGQPAPDFSALDLSNRLISLNAYRGQKVVLLDFWATWCGPCRMEMVDLDALLAKFKNAGFEILSLDQGESTEQVSQFIHRKHYDFHALLDNGAVSARYGVRAIPTLVLVDKHGIVQWLQVGYARNDNSLDQKIQSLLKE